ncbi:MAG: 4-hydroxy-tetrahydrodipicolinate reductase [Deltaproteobacteria bacterium]|jgi:4-hydroxy-tetrahydrodipicolinate reductase|nr:4-hydroxy-tetrahydrodipicolinate reductase [Deltaproteobacteria bacterium]
MTEETNAKAGGPEPTADKGTVVNVMVAGALGRMGKLLLGLLSQDPRFLLTGALESPECPDIGKDVGELSGVGKLGVTLSQSFPEAAKGASVYLDFSSPQGVSQNIVEADILGVAAVIGVTALDQVILAQLKEASQRIGVLVAPNMSTGVNIMYRVAARMASLLGEDYDIEIVEAHHNRKKDAPSGTAMRLCETICRERDLDPSKAAVFGRHGMPGPRPKGEIGIHAIRGGDIVGDHTVIFAGPGETLELTHRAQTRDAFAKGALKAALWMAGRAPGYYSYAEVLGS